MPVPEIPHVGDIALAEIDSLGKNQRLKLATGRNSNLHAGVRLAVVFGNRYATSQFEGYAAADEGMCDMLSMAGVCGLVKSKHDKTPAPTRLRLLGSVGDANGRRLNLKDFSLPPMPLRVPPRRVVVCGSAMDVGKTFTAVSLIAGLRHLGERVAAAKLTGTATGRDEFAMQDVEADPVLDFVDCGLPSTYLCTLDELLEIDRRLTAEASAEGASWMVIEIADGLLQKETKALLSSPRFTSTVDAWVFACGDPLATVGGVRLLRNWGIEPLAVSGVVTLSPLAMSEVVDNAGVPCVSADDLRAGVLNDRLMQIRRTTAS